VRASPRQARRPVLGRATAEVVAVVRPLAASEAEPEDRGGDAELRDAERD
jgi:hypothetical protein